MRHLTLLLACLPYTYATGQQLLDASDHSPLPYATAAVLHTDLGTVADADGKVNLPAKAADGDTVLLSAVGYRARKFTVAELRGRDTLQLVPEPYALGQIDVLAGQFNRTRSYGSTPRSKRVVCAFLHGQAGEQIGRVLNLKRESFVKTVRVSIVSTNVEGIRCRVRFYPMEADTASLTPIPHPDVFFTIDRAGIFEVDLSEQGIILPQNVIVAIELINPPPTGKYLYFGGALLTTRAIYRAHAAGPWFEGTTSAKGNGRKGVAVAAGIEVVVLQ